ncbi:MAG: CZB domain-containing protein [Candidatus Omnitrophica bacterium]|nr:CZB domain-containing protein [Candidatus Omnitrophota bacterium]
MDFDFNHAGIFHLVWKRKLRNFIDGGIQEPENITHKRCELGNWIYTIGAISYGDTPEFKNLEKIHLAYHNAAFNLINKVKAGDKESAEKEYVNLDMLCKEIVSSLTFISLHNKEKGKL